MNNTNHLKLTPLLLALALALRAAGVVVAGGSIDPTHRWAWGTNVGWINFAPDHGGVTVYSDHLEGYAWGEGIGWIRLGTHTGGGAHTYANDAATTYGVNNDGAGTLSGYAWGTNVGWINFAPENGGVTIDPLTGDFDGYAWGENVGWIRVRGTAPAYSVNTTWRVALPETYRNDVAALTPESSAPVVSAGLGLAAEGFPAQPGDSIVIGHNNAGFAGAVTGNLPGGVDIRWGRVWELIVTNVSGSGGRVHLTFDISGAGGQGSFADGGTYFLLKRATGSTDAFTVVPVVGTPTVSGDRITFTVEVADLGSEFTLGATAGSPTGTPVLQHAIHLPLVVNHHGP